LYLGSKDFDGPFMNIDGDNLMTKENFQKFVDNIEPDKDLIGVTHSYTEDAVFTKLNDKNEITEFSREPISEFEWTGVAYFAKTKIKKEGKFIYQELEDKLPVQACIIECFEVDTPQDLEYVSKNFKFDEF
jgi:choline kinase